MKIYAAPLQGYTEAPWRNAHEKIFGGIDAYFAPFIRLDKHVNEEQGIRNKDLRDVDPKNNKVKCLVPQILASEPDEFCHLTDILLEKGYKWIDINMGCPFPMIVKRHKGCGILQYPKMVEEILLQTRRYPEIEFSVKMRLGAKKEDEWKEIVPILNETDLKLITLHPRTGKQQYKGEPNMSDFKLFTEKCNKSLVYNGNISAVTSIVKMEDNFPSLYGIMIGRGLLGQFSLACDYRQGTMSDIEMHAKTVLMHDEVFNDYKERLQGDSQLLCKMKCFWEYMQPNMDKKIYKEIKKSTSIEKYVEAVRKFQRL